MSFYPPEYSFLIFIVLDWESLKLLFPLSISNSQLRHAKIVHRERILLRALRTAITATTVATLQALAQLTALTALR
jgi:NADH:ubiquinone oxidoreductase subunit 3 (subunit A)